MLSSLLVNDFVHVCVVSLRILFTDQIYSLLIQVDSIDMSLMVEPSQNGIYNLVELTPCFRYSPE